MHGIQASLFKYISVAAFCICAQCGEVGEVGGHALNSHVKYMLIIENHGIVFLCFCGNPVRGFRTYGLSTKISCWPQ